MDFPELLVGALIALPFEFLVHMGWDRFKVWRKEVRTKNKYGFLAREYTNLRAGMMPTGGSVVLTQNKNGTFRVTGLHPDRTTEWEGELRMSSDEEDVGAATYRYLLKSDYGTQRVVYLPHRDALHVLGTNQSTTDHLEFVHVWEPLIHVGRILS